MSCFLKIVLLHLIATQTHILSPSSVTTNAMSINSNSIILRNLQMADPKNNQADESENFSSEEFEVAEQKHLRKLKSYSMDTATHGKLIAPADTLERWEGFKAVPHALVLKAPCARPTDKIVDASVHIFGNVSASDTSAYILNIYGNYKNDDASIEKRLIKTIEPGIIRDGWNNVILNDFSVNMIELVVEIQRRNDNVLEAVDLNEVRMLTSLDSKIYKPHMMLYKKETFNGGEVH